LSLPALRLDCDPATSPDRLAARPAARRRRRCQVGGCAGPFSGSVEIRLPSARETSQANTVLTVRVDACGTHTDELKRVSAALLEGRAEVGLLLATIEEAILTDSALRREIAQIAAAALRAASPRSSRW
jgi:hypothetical protein